jgi:glycerol-3-phosphate dehydrogenase
MINAIGMPSQSTQLIVIGGGATGLGVALDACLRGIKVLVIEKGDLAQGTSGRYHGLLHSGGRYVLSDPSSARDCARENRILRRIAPATIEDTDGLFVSVAGDPVDYPEAWRQASLDTQVPFEEITPSKALESEPALTPEIQRAFRVRDASLDSFDLLHALAETIRIAGGHILLRHKLERVIIERGVVEAVVVQNLRTGESRTIGAELVVNAAGPWAHTIAELAGIDVPIALSKGTMVAMAGRAVHTVINRCRPAGDGDIIVPVGTVAVLGTTDLPVETAQDLEIRPEEIDFLLAQADVLLPGIIRQRPLRAWAGVRPLLRPEAQAGSDTRELPRGHAILDHHRRDGVRGLISVFGGKLTTYRLMAEETMQIAASYLNVSRQCRTADTPIQSKRSRYHQLPSRLSEAPAAGELEPPHMICECEIVTYQQLLERLSKMDQVVLDDLRRDLRLGMGPCQGGFCTYRAAGAAHEEASTEWPEDGLESFLEERWKGIQPLAWGHGLRQMELTRRIYLELFGVDSSRSPRT